MCSISGPPYAPAPSFPARSPRRSPPCRHGAPRARRCAAGCACARGCAANHDIACQRTRAQRMPGQSTAGRHASTRSQRTRRAPAAICREPPQQPLPRLRPPPTPPPPRPPPPEQPLQPPRPAPRQSTCSSSLTTAAPPCRLATSSARSERGQGLPHSRLPACRAARSRSCAPRRGASPGRGGGDLDLRPPAPPLLPTPPRRCCRGGGGSADRWPLTPASLPAQTPDPARHRRVRLQRACWAGVLRRDPWPVEPLQRAGAHAKRRGGRACRQVRKAFVLAGKGWGLAADAWAAQETNPAARPCRPAGGPPPRHLPPFALFCPPTPCAPPAPLAPSCTPPPPAPAVGAVVHLPRPLQEWPVPPADMQGQRRACGGLGGGGRS